VDVLLDEHVIKKNAPLVVISDMGNRGEIVDSVLLIHA